MGLHPTPQTLTCSYPTYKRNLTILRRNRTTVRSHCRADFLTHTHSGRSYTRNLPVRRRDSSRNGGEPMSAALSSHTSHIAPTATCCSCSLWFFVLLFPHAENCAFIVITHASVRLFSSCVSLVCAVPSDCAVLLATAWRTKDGGIMSGLSLSMQVS